MNTWIYALASVSVVSVISLCGVLAIPLSRKTLSTVVFFLLSLGTGAMLGNAIVHLIPEAFAHSENTTTTSLLILYGFMACFVFQKVLHLNCHHAMGSHEALGEAPARKTVKGGLPTHIHPTGYMSLISHGMDNFTDGVIIGAAYLTSPAAGIATSLAVILHEIPMELGGFGVLVFAGFSKRGAILANFSSAMVATAGTIAALALGRSIAGLPGMLTPFAAGMVLFVTAAGLIPQMLKETDNKRSVWQMIMMAIGIGLMVLVKLLGHHH